MTSESQNVFCLIKCLDIVHLRTDWHQHEVRNLGRSYGGVSTLAGRIDHGKLCTLLLGGFEHLIEPRNLARHDDRKILAAAVAPFGSCGLRVEIVNSDFFAGEGEGHGKT